MIKRFLHNNAKISGVIIGGLYIGALCGFTIPFSINQFHKEVVWQRIHHPGWAVRYAKITSQSRPFLTIGQSFKPSEIQFNDLYGHTLSQKEKMPMSSHVGDRVRVYINSSDNIYIPSAVGNDPTTDPTYIDAGGNWWGGDIYLALGFGGAISVAILIAMLETVFKGLKVTKPHTDLKGRLGSYG